jgi:transcriptional regulator with XRE-family HTH domain
MLSRASTEMSPAMRMSATKHPTQTSLERLRWQYGLSIREVADGCKMNAAHYYRMECGDIAKPTDPTYQRIADFYGLPVDTVKRMYRR